MSLSRSAVLHDRGGRRLRLAVALQALLLVALVAGLSVPLTAAAALAAAPGSAPSLVSPADASMQVGNPVLRWSPLADAAKYRVEISASPDFATTAYKADTTNTSVTPPAELPLGTLHWRVTGLGADGAAGPPAVWTFTKEFPHAPEPSEPADEAVLSFPSSPALFVWQPLAGAKTYEIEVDDDPDFVGVVTQATDLTSLTLKEPQSVGTYYWRVRGKSDGINSQWSTVRSYAVTWPGTPVLTSPANTFSPPVEDVVLKWTPVDGAAKYHLQISPNADWTNNVVIDTTVLGTQYSPLNSTATTSLNNGNYYWRVQALDARKVSGAGQYSLVGRFQRGWADQPALLAPADSEQVDEVRMEWTPVDHASHYEVQISTDRNFTATTSPKNPLSCYTTGTSFSPYEVIPPAQEGGVTVAFPGRATDCAVDPHPGQTYYWRVRGIDAPATPAILGVFSTPRSFVYRPAVPTVAAGVDSRSYAPVLAWNPVAGYSKYKVTVLRSTGTVLKAEETFANSYTPTVATAAGTYSWYVQTVDDSGRLGLLPDARGTFTVEAPTTADHTEAPEPLAATGGGLVAPSLSWQPVEGAKSYAVRVNRPGSTILRTVTPAAGVTLPAFTPTAVLASGEWEWTVVASTAAGAVHSTTAGSFSVDELDVVSTYVGEAACTTAPCLVRETPELQWGMVPEAGHYRVYVANDPEFTNRVRVYRTQYTSLTPREAYLDNQAGESFYWFVRPCISDAACGPLEGELQRRNIFSKSSPSVALQLPAAGAAVTAAGLSFSWQDYRTTNAQTEIDGRAWNQSARGYRLQVATTVDGFGGPLVDDVVIDQTSYAPRDKTYPEGPLFWRVQAIDGTGNALTWSDVRRLDKSSGSPAVLAPVSSTVERSPFFRWEPLSGAASYELEVYKNGDTNFSAANKIAAGTATTMQTAWAPVQALGGQGDYAWRLRGVDVAGRKLAWTVGRVFGLQAGSPELIAPDAVSTSDGRNLVFDWGPVAGAAAYRFQTSTSPSFTSGLQQQVTVMTEWAPTTQLPSGTSYWRVQVLDARGNVVATSPATEAEQAERTVVVCGTGGTDTDGDGLQDACDDVIDLSRDDALYPFVKTLIASGVSTGCGERLFCPNQSVSRSQMSVFLLRSAEGAQYVPPPGTGVFSDVPSTFPTAHFIEELKRRGITGGCTTDAYCPSNDVTRGQMAVFLLRSVEGGDYLPPEPTGVFDDVPVGLQFDRWIEELSARQITSGCTATSYCPASPVTRRQMAAFLVRAFGMPLAA